MPRQPPKVWREPSAERTLFANADVRAVEIAAVQHGVVARRQLTAAGLGEATIARRIADGRLIRLHRGVYAYGHTALRPQAYRLAAVLACGPGAHLSHRSAAEAWGLRASARPRHEVTAPRGGGRGMTTVDTYRNVLHEVDQTTVDAIPITTVARTALDIAGQLPRHQLDKALRRAEELRLFDLKALDDVVRRGTGHRGTGALRRALHRLRPEPHFTRSELERMALKTIGAHALPRPQVNRFLHTHEVDLFWAQARLVAELDGYAFHRSRMAFETDRRRDAELTARGYRVLRFTWYQLEDEPGWVAATIAAALRRSYSDASRPPWACGGGPSGPSSAGSTLPE